MKPDFGQHQKFLSVETATQAALLSK